MTWVEALTTDRVWDEARDAPRIRHAFAVLARERTSWPAVRHLLDALPKVETPRLLSNRSTHTEEHRAAMLARLQRESADLFNGSSAA